MDKSIIDIIHNFESEGTLLVDGTRNKIKIFPLENKILNIKSFKIPLFYNGFIYRFFRKPKAQRSFEFANYLSEKGIGTPKPIGFYVKKKLLTILDSYYVCEHIEVDYVFKDLFDAYIEDLDTILTQFAQFCFKLHEAGIEFKDHSPGNTLIKKDAFGNYQFYLIDLNRMTFHTKMSFDLRMKNLERITPSEDMIKIISKEYAKLYQRTDKEVFDKMWYYTKKFQHKFWKKKEIKKKLGL
jgi:hypothetical protein